MQYNKSESNIIPDEVEAITGGRFFIRDNIKEVKKTNENGEETTRFVYDEAIVSEAEFAAIMAVRNFESRREAEIIDEYTMQLINEGVL